MSALAGGHKKLPGTPAKLDVLRMISPRPAGMRPPAADSASPRGEIVVRMKLTRGRVLPFFESLPHCPVGDRSLQLIALLGEN